MSDEISLLPEELRKKEEVLKHTSPPPPEAKGQDLRFSVPKEEGEDIEVIEIDEGEVDQVLESEPPLTRFIYKVSAAFDDMRQKLFQPRAVEPPPKLPPQFFTPPPKKPLPGAPPTAAAVGAPTPAPAVGAAALAAGEKPKARVVPFEKVPRRVRVIKRIRKPVRVSFVSEEDLRLMRVDIPKRRFTFITVTILFAVLLGGSWYLLDQQKQAAASELSKADKQLGDLRRAVQEKQAAWTSFQDLEPRLKALAGLLRQHVSANRLLESIETYTLPTVAYQSMSLSADRRVTLLVVADSFETAAGQVATFQKAPFVKKIEAAGYTATYDPPDSYVPKSVEFQAVLTLSDDALVAPSGAVATP